MDSEDCFVCFCLYGFWGLICVFCLYGVWGLLCVFYMQSNPQNSYRQTHTKQSSEPIEIKTYKTILKTHTDKNTQNNPQNSYRQNIFVSMGSVDCFVCFFLYGFWGLCCVFFSLWVLRIILCVFSSMDSEDCFVCLYRQKHTKQSSELI
jgi:hypothetical protein